MRRITRSPEKAISDGGGGGMARNFAIVKGLIDLRKLAKEKGLKCERCGLRPATGIGYVAKRFVHYCDGCCGAANVTVAPIPSRTTSSPAPHQFNLGSWARYKAAKRDEFINHPAPAPVRPQRAAPHPAGDSANYRTPKIVPTRWSEAPDDRP